MATLIDIKEITNEELKSEIMKNDLLIFVIIKADWCGTCYLMAPIVADISTEFQDSITAYIIDFDKNKEFILRYGIFELPHFLFFREGKLIDQQKGIISKTKLIKLIQSYLRERSKK